MKFLILFCLFAAVAAMANPNSSPLRAPITLDPKNFEEKIWQYVDNVNDELLNIFIPTKVTKVVSDVVRNPQAERMTFEAIFEESYCIKSDTERFKFSATNCLLLPKGKRYLMRINHLSKDDSTIHISVLKIRELQPNGVSTSTQSSSTNGYTDSDSTGPANGKRNARDLESIYGRN
ncbi:unnamed protein product [Caenorhabditis brenneri]